MRKFPSVVEDYLGDLRRIRVSGGATGERSGYGPLANLLNAIGGGLKPKVFCVGELADQGAGHPDFGLYAAKQVQRGGQPKDDQLPEHGVVEVKSAEDDAWLTAESAQVSRYWGRYRLVLVTNYRDFLLVGEDSNGNPARLESFPLAANAEDFERQLERPRAFAGQVGVGLGEYLRRVLSHRARLAEPRDLAELLASHARDALARVEAAEGESGASAGPLETFALPGGGCPEDPHPDPLPRGEGARAAADRGDEGRCATVSVGDGSGGAGRGAGRAVQGRARGTVLPVDAGADAVLRGLFGLGAVGASDSAADWLFQVARGRLAPAGTGVAGAISAALGSGAFAAAGAGGGAGLDGGGAEPGRAGGFLRALQRGTGRDLLLRAVPASLRPGGCASNWASGTRRRRWCATWWREWTRR